jgi:hypothetical protein
MAYHGKPALKSSILFRTNSFFDNIFLIRDTLTAYATLPDFNPLYHSRIVHEGNTHFTEKVWTRVFGSDSTQWQVKRLEQGKTRVDTMLYAPNAGYDFINIFLYLRQLNYSGFNPGDTRYVTTVLGDKKVNLIIRYAGSTRLKAGGKQPHKAFYLLIDISNEVFSEAKSAMEVWISDDEHHIPLKMKAKLKIGAAEAELI